MPIKTTLLIIADIGGYTRFIRQHRTALAHAHLIISELLEAVIAATAGGFELSKLEGDAAFLYKTVDGERPQDLAHLVDAAVAVHRAFHFRLDSLSLNNLCGCEACRGLDRLFIKVVAHIGDTLFTRIRRMTELAGEDVIRVHRMLKNDVPIPEYVLCSPEITRHLPADLRNRVHEVTLDMEGFEETRGFYLDLQALAAARPVSTKKPWPMRVLGYLWRDARSLPYWLGFKQAMAGFRNVPSS